MKLGRSPLVSLDHGEGTEGIEPGRLDDVVSGGAELGNVPNAREPALSAAPGQPGDQIGKGGRALSGFCRDAGAQAAAGQQPGA